MSAVFVELASLPPLSTVANRILALSSAPDVDLKQLVDVMECEPAFAANVLTLANSAAFGFPSRIDVLRQAIALLGLDRIKALAITVGMRTFLGDPGPLLKRCWEHSVACAMIAGEISPMFKIRSDSAYTEGLLHDAGRLALLKAHPAPYAAVLDTPFDGADGILQAEREALGADHCVAGAWMVKHWALPASFTAVCELHHQALQAEEPKLLQVIKISCRMADAMGFCGACYLDPLTYDGLLLSLPPQIPRHLLPPGDQLKANIQARLQSFR